MFAHWSATGGDNFDTRMVSVHVSSGRMERFRKSGPCGRVRRAAWLRSEHVFARRRRLYIHQACSRGEEVEEEEQIRTWRGHSSAMLSCDMGVR